MTARGRAVLALGVLCWIVAIMFGSTALYPVAAGLVIVVPLAVAWVRITLRQPHASRRWRHENLLERDDVTIELVLDREPGVPLPNVVAHEHVGRPGPPLGLLPPPRPAAGTPLLRAGSPVDRGPVRPRRGRVGAR